MSDLIPFTPAIEDDDAGTYDPRAHSAQCDRCPLRGRPFVPPAGNPASGFVLVGDSPSMSDVTHGRPFTEAAGVKLAEVLAKAGKARAEVWTTNAILCRPEVPGETGTRRYDVALYLAWLRKENARRKKEARLTQREPELLASPFECCFPRLRGELHRAERAAKAQGWPNGAVVVPLGSFALGAVQGQPGKPASIMKWRGSVIPFDLQEL